jgi:hypothetical protein
MKTFEKHYIGKGKQVEGLQIAKVTCKLDDILKHTHEFKGDVYICFEVAKMLNTDRFGNDFTVYVNKLVEKADPPKNEKPATKAAMKPKKETTKKAKDKNDEEIPF